MIESSIQPPLAPASTVHLAAPDMPTVAHPIAWPELGGPGTDLTQEQGVPATESALSKAGSAAIEKPRALADNRLLHHVRISVSVNIGSAQLCIGELLETRVGDVFTLDRSIDQDIDLLLDGQVVARGRLVAVEEFFAVQITEVALVPGPA